VKQFYKSKGAGGLQLNISKGDSLSVKIPLPNVANQDLVVEELDTLSKETQRLTRLYERKLAALEELKKSLLHQAFNGEL
jgi:type I restriction enzyme, S subunit